MDVVEKLLALLRIPSVTGDEGAICDFLLEQLREKPALALRRVGNSFAVFPKQFSERSHLALVGHLDTVPPTRENSPRQEQDRVYGLSAADMKGGLALMWQHMHPLLQLLANT